MVHAIGLNSLAMSGTQGYKQLHGPCPRAARGTGAKHIARRSMSEQDNDGSIVRMQEVIV